MEELRPGRIVDFVDYDGTHYPAIVTQVQNASHCYLTIFKPMLPPTPTPYAVSFDESGERTMSWHWLERA